MRAPSSRTFSPDKKLFLAAALPHAAVAIALPAVTGMGGMPESAQTATTLSLLFTPSGAETLVFWVSQPLAWLVAPKDVLLMTRRGDLKLSHGATAKARENAVKQDRVQTTNAIKSP